MSLDPYYFTPRKDIISLVPQGIERVLDVGCGGGRTGTLLKEIGVREVFGIEKNEDVARYAKEYYDQVIVGDVEKIELPFPPLYFDLLIYGDVLEHLFDPWSLLKKHRKFLKDGGFIIVSLPNVRYYKVIKRLLIKGRWDYEDQGIMDLTHIRFFTLKTALELLRDSGFEVLRVRGKISGSKLLKFANRMVFGMISDFLIRQYLILGRKLLGCQESRSSSRITMERI